MKHSNLRAFVIVGSLVWCCAARIPAAEEPAQTDKRPVVYNVRDYGAKGDGQTDDTAAILKTLEATYKDPVRTSAQTIPGAPYYGIQPEVLFPAGTYRLTAPIPLTYYTRFRGEGSAALKPDKPDQDIFVAHPEGANYRTQISGLLFLGGGRAIALNTHNLDSAHILIQRCQFYGQNICAVFCEDGCNSTLLKIADCQFMACEQVLRNTCDTAVIADCWIETRLAMKNKAVIENRGRLIAENILGVPLVARENNQRWIDNYGCLTCRSFRFGGEGGGFTPVVNFAAYERKWPVIPNSVILEDCHIYNTGDAGKNKTAAIYCHEVPNIIAVRSCSGLVNVSVVLLDPKINPDAYFADAVANPSLCRYLLRDNSVNEMWLVENLPPVMRKFCSQPAGAVNVREFFVTGSGGVDDTLGLQTAMDYAETARQPVLIPAGTYKISKTIQVKTDVRGEGNPVIFSEAKNIDLFYNAGARVITIDGIRFQGGKDQVSIGNMNCADSMFTVRNCEFRNADGAAVRFRKNSNSTSAFVERCGILYCRQALVTWCDGTALRDCWITTSIEMKNMAAIENQSGTLTCEKILGVPLVNGCDQRWIDNYAEVVCRDFRFGGEGSGFTPVVNFAKRARSVLGPKVVLDSCALCALGNSQRPCAVYCEEIPNQIAIINCELAGIRAVIVDKKINLKTYLNDVRPGMLRFDVIGNIGEFVGKLPEEMLQAAAKRTGEANYGAAQLTADETAKAMAVAVATAKKLPDLPAGVMVEEVPKGEKGHTQQIAPEKYVDLVPPRASWDLQDFTDATSESNAERLAVAQADSRMVIVKRIGADSEFGCWPHVLVKGVNIDLDKTPWLTWRLRDVGFKSNCYAVKVVDTSTGKTVKPVEQWYPPFFDYRAYDLRKAFDFKGGKHSLQVKFYYLGLTWDAPAFSWLKAKKGEYLVVDFLRAEAD